MAPNRTRFAIAARVVVLIVAVGAASACGAGSPVPAATGGGPAGLVPPPPSTPRQSLGASSPPVIWLGGTIQLVGRGQVRLLEDDGSVVGLTRLAEGATRFFRVQGDAWSRIPNGERVVAGQRACIETLMDGTNLVAIRVFLGAGCGPI